MKSGALSVLVPVFNHARYLPELFRTLEEQSRPPKQIIFSDDRSMDGSPALVEAWAAGQSHVRLVRQQQNLGITENSNFLLRKAVGDYVLTLHSDDCLGQPDALAKMVEVLDRQPGVAMVTAPRQMIDEVSNPIRIEKKIMPGIYPRREVLRRILTTEAGEPSAVMFRRKALAAGFDPTYRQLWDLKGWLEILRAGDLAVLDSPLMKIREHIGQATRANTKVGRGVVEHLDLFSQLALNSNEILGNPEKSVLLHKLSRTAGRNSELGTTQVLSLLRRERQKIGFWRYWGNLCGYRLRKVFAFFAEKK
ncbi:MAG: glycosyltransferase family 2 protein [Verrucomicrobia bacterium]|nr:glycosyltransferase family 2 protein [Verrucomicrobiota bacterium]